MKSYSLITASIVIGAFAGSATAQQTKPTPPTKPAIQKTAPLHPTVTTPSAGYLGINDDCATPTPVVAGLVAFDNSGATTGTAGQAEGICYFFGTTGIESDVWFAYSASVNGDATVTSCSLTTVDTKMAAYPGAGCPADGTSIACNDDACGLQSTIMFPVTLGSTYSIQVGTFPGSSSGAGMIDIMEMGTTPDDCATPVAVFGAGMVPFDNTLATTGTAGQAEATCDFFGTTGIDNDLWYAYTASIDGDVVVETCGITTVDTKIAAYPGMGCPADGTSIACNDDTCGLQSSIGFPISAGTTYTVQLGTFPGSSGGVGMVNFTEVGVPPPANDDCSTPEFLGGAGTYPFDVTLATTGTDGQANSLCYFFGTVAIENDVWYEFVADCSGTATVTTCDLTAVDTKMAAYAGSGCPGDDSAIACNDDACGLQSTISFDVDGGSSYTIQLGTFPGAGSAGPGEFDLSIDCVATPVCFGDGLGTPCPCGNDNSGGNGGCANSINSAGAILGSAGNPSVSDDTFELVATGMPANVGMFFQGTNGINGDNGFLFGDGLRCCGDGEVRLVLVSATQNGSGDICASSHNGQVDCGIVVGGNAGAISLNPRNQNPAMMAGTVRCYQYWYRDSVGPCESGFNLTNALSVEWKP